MLRMIFAAAMLCALPSIAYAGKIHAACNVAFPCEKSATSDVRQLPKRHTNYTRDYAHTMPFNSTSNIVARARAYIGAGAIFGRARLWCATFANYVLKQAGHRGTGSDMARSFASYGRRVPGPQIGAIAVMHRKGGGHVGFVSGIDPHGNPIVVSGNHNRRVAEAVYPRARVYAYVVPD